MFFNRKLPVFLFLLSCLTFSAFAQRELFEKADGFYSANLYKDAIIAYEKALALDAEQPTAIARLAESYYMTNNLPKAEEYYAKAIGYSNMQKYIFEYAQCLKSNGKLADAKKWFLEYAKINPTKGAHYAASCDYVQKQVFSQPLFEVKPQPALNSKNSDFAPIIYDNRLIFASARSISVEKAGKMTWTNDAFNQHYIAEIDLQKDSLKSLRALRSYVGRDINDAPMSYSKKGDLVALSSNNFMDGIRHIEGSGLLMDIYIYQTKNYNEWEPSSEQFFSFNAGVDSEKPYSTGHPCLSSDGGAMYFASNRPGGFGGYDLYVSYRTKSGWTAPKNLGENVNTAGNEMCPFTDEFGRLFFSSDWHYGFGGMDVFVSERAENGIDWLPCQNLGQPVNSPFDDMYFVFDGRYRYGYFSSNRFGGQGNEDIYKATMQRTLPPPVRSSLKQGDKVSLNDAFNSSGQLVTLSSEFQSFLEAFKNQPNLVLQVYVHSDSRGSSANNLNLTQQLAKNASDYLIANGIAANRIRYQGMGEQFTLNGCNDGIVCNEEEHRRNRRSDFIVIGRLSESGLFVREYEPLFSSATPVNSNNSDPNYRPNAADPNNITKTLPDTKTSSPVITQPTTNVTQPTKKVEKKSHYAVGDVIEVASIFYLPNAANVDEKSPGLVELIEVLNSHKHTILEIGAHTDAVGTTAYNLDLSQRRADALKAYLIKKGIAADRLLSKGYGESQIKNRCKDGVNCTDAENAVNRRTEFKVVGHQGFKVGDVIKVAEIHYEMNKDILDMKRSSGLQEIIQILKKNEISLEIRSHTDSKGTSEYNLELSERRAKAVYDYLVQSGISKHRLKYKGYGETMLINRCKDGVKCTDAEHAANRRTDFKVVGLK